MQAPLVLTTHMTHSAEMAAALLTGVGFGFALERAGFGTAKNLVSVFYGRDFRVLRVMFTAIVTAMLGLYFLDLAGVMPIGNIGLIPTYFWPQLVGGLLLGFGFIIGGYCPGTSIVALVSGKVDALFFLGGLFAGSMLFTVSYAPLMAFHQSTDWGRLLLHEFFGIPSGPMVALVALFALGAFAATNKIEALVNRTAPRRNS